MTTATLPARGTEIELDDLFDLDVRIEETDTDAEAGFTSFGCSLSCLGVSQCVC
ncbi:FDLD family class I lanthipeptide [Kitasatospora sp. NPDC008050]|uniref:FDLD family class I lanthipeptide n=1 Tax=Kitasatospora sp. NPDC008050 TaxID=3364021 RepID=UPI0036E45952